MSKQSLLHIEFICHVICFNSNDSLFIRRHLTFKRWRINPETINIDVFFILDDILFLQLKTIQ